MNRIPIDINDPVERPRTFWERVTDVVSVGFAWSMLIHALLLICFALIMMPQLAERRGFVVFATEASDSVSKFDSVADISLEESGAEESTTEETLELITQPTDGLLPISAVVEKKSTTEKTGSGKGDTQGDGKGGRKLRAPANAVRRGSFSAWTVPIAQYRGETPKPGDSPRPGQHYHIVIQLQLPKGMTRYRVSDLTGSVEGTDKYRLQLPNRTFYFNDEGRLEEADSRTYIPVIDDVVQILVHVPGAKFAAVKDTINLSSRRLAEKQELELVFEDTRRQ